MIQVAREGLRGTRSSCLVLFLAPGNSFTPMKQFFGAIGYKTIMFFGKVYEATNLTREALYWLIIAPLRGKGLRFQSSIEQMVLIGVSAIPIVSVLSLFVGMILAFQGAYVLRVFGAELYIADLVGITMTRELSPLVASIIVAGRSGSAFTAEIGTMKVSEEVDALVTIGLNPTKFLVIPKLLGIIVMLPCLTLLSDIIAMIGGTVIAVGLYEVVLRRYIVQTVEALLLRDILSGLFKSFVFAIIIALVGCYEGFQTEGGAEEVGIHTTASVVKSIFFIIFADLIVTFFLNYL